MDSIKIELISIFKNYKSKLIAIVFTNIIVELDSIEVFKQLVLTLWNQGKNRIKKKRVSHIFFSKFELFPGNFQVSNKLLKVKLPIEIEGENPRNLIESDDLELPIRFVNKLKDRIKMKKTLKINEHNKDTFTRNLEIDTPTEYYKENSVDQDKPITKLEDVSISKKHRKGCLSSEHKFLAGCEVEVEKEEEISNNIKMLKEINFLDDNNFTIKRCDKFYYAELHNKCGHAYGDILTNRQGISCLFDGLHYNITRLNFWQIYYL